MAETDTNDYVLENQVGHLLRRAHQRHVSIFQENTAADDLTPLQFAAVMKLLDVGETSQNQLGRLTAMDAATMQGVVKRLIARGMVERRPDPNDRRRLVLSLSGDGKKLAGAMRRVGHDITDRTLEPLSASERKTFLALLEKLA